MPVPEPQPDDLYGFKAKRPSALQHSTLENPADHSLAAGSLALTSFPLERPRLRSRRKSDRIVGSTLPYFISGQENRLVAFVATAHEDILQIGNPILLIGATGTGKSVLGMHLAAREAANVPQRLAIEPSDHETSDAKPISRNEPVTVTYLPAIDFARRYAEAVDNDDLPPLRQEIDQAAVLMIDDIHLINDKGPAQEELASRIEGRTFAGRLTIVTCRLLPSEIRGMRSSLVSRTVPGLTIPIQPPGKKARQVILHELSLIHNVDLEAPLLAMLGEGLDPKASFRELEATIKQIGLWCRMNDAEPDTTAVQSALELVGSSTEITLASITSNVARRFRLRSTDLKSSSRRQNIVRARSLAMTLARRLTDTSLLQIGEHFGGRDHSTVLHAIRKTESGLKEDATLRRIADEVTEKLTSND